MGMKSRATAMRTALAESAGERGSADVIKAAWAVMWFVGGLILSSAKVLGGVGPFGAAAVSAAGAGVNGIACLLGSCIGCLLSGGLSGGVRCLAAAVIVFTVAFAFQDTKFYAHPVTAPLFAAFAVLGTDMLAKMTSLVSVQAGTAAIFLETTLAFGGSWFFREAMSEAERTTEQAELRHSASVLITAACLLMSLSGLEVFGAVSVGRFAAVIFVMTVSLSCGMALGCTVGTAFGLAMDIAAGGMPFFTLAYAFSGLLSGVFNRHGRLIFALSFVLANGVAVACTWSVAHEPSSLLEVFCASVVFMLLPTGFISRFGAILRPTECGSGESGLRRYVSKRVMGLSAAYSGLYEIVRRNVEEQNNDSDPAKVFDRAAGAVCINCGEKNRCWNSEYMDTLSALNDAGEAMLDRGTLSLGDIPARFAEKCRTPEAFVAAVNGELRSRAYRKQFGEQLRESRDTAWGQYADMADMLESVSRELGGANGADHLAERRLIRFLRGLDIDADTAVYRDGRGRLRCIIEGGNLAALIKDDTYLDKLSAVLGLRMCSVRSAESAGRITLMEAEPLAVSVGIAAMKKQGEKVSGDRGTYFKTDSGVLCVILSDGMGCGVSAAKESAEVIDILEKFLRSGVDPAVAMKTLSSVMLLRAGDNLGFATVDLMCVDLFSGETCFYKYGAAPSYVLSGKSIRRIKGTSFAPGLDRGGAPDMVRMRLKPGSTAIIASDGVIGDSNDGWLREVLDSSTEDMKLLARDTLREAERIYGKNDDMTVLAVRVQSRE